MFLRNYLIIFVLVSYVDAKYHLINESQTIDVDERDYISLQISDISTGICGYTIPQNADYNCSYDLTHNSTTNEANGPVATHCFEGAKLSDTKCLVDIRSFNGTYPREWTLTSDQGDNLHITVNVNFFYNAVPFKTKINVKKGEGFIQYLTFPNGENKKLSKCYISYNDTKFELELDSKSEPESTNRNKELAERIESLGQGTCGFTLIGAKENDPEEWVITAIDDENVQNRTTFNVAFFEGQPPNKSMEVHFGDSTGIYCGYKDESTDICQLYNPEGKFVHTKSTNEAWCYYSLPTVTRADIGDWKCVTSNSYAMTTSEHTINLSIKDEPEFKTWITDKGDHVEIGCQALNYNINKLTYCTMIVPNGQKLIVQPSMITDRYRSIKTNLEKYICSIELKKPLLGYELGHWTCQLTEKIGAFISNGGSPPKYPTHMVKHSLVGEPFTINCQVGYSTNICHIKDPKGQVLKNNNKSWLGVCSATIDKVMLEHNGTWTCNFPRETGVPDEVIKVELRVAEELLTYKGIQVTKGEKAELMCQTGFPIQFCQFVSPNGLSYHLTKTQSKSNIQYSGRGLEYGDCGILITNAQAKHNGTWICNTRLGISDQKNDIHAEVYLHVNVPFIESATTVATAVGISLGVIVVLGIGVALVVRKRRQLRRNIQSASIRRSSDISEDSNTNQELNQTAPPFLIPDQNREVDNVIFQLR